jgi:carbon-monoxide dehydrogenase small subunit
LAGGGSKTVIDIALVVNGQAVQRTVDERDSLLCFLRHDLNLCGTKEGCSTGDCGTCVVLVDGKPEDACLYNLRRAQGVTVETIESLVPPGGPLHPLQAAFLECGAVQCGFCTPGMIMAVAALLKDRPHPSDEEIYHGLEGNLCRCTGYINIVKAVKQAAHVMQGK